MLEFVDYCETCLLAVPCEQKVTKDDSITKLYKDFSLSEYGSLCWHADTLMVTYPECHGIVRHIQVMTGETDD